MPAGSLAEYEPPQEIVALGEPIWVFARSRAATERLCAAVRGFGFLTVLVSSMVLGLFFTTAPPEARESTGSVIAASVLGGFFFIAGAFLIVVPVKPWPAHAYAGYPENLAFLSEGTWSVIRWDDVDRWRDQSLRSFWPALVLRDGREVVLRNDFAFPAFLYNAIREQRRVFQFAPETANRPAAVRDAADTQPVELVPVPEVQVRSQKRWAAALFLVGLGMIVANARWIAAAARGPVPITTAQLSAAEDPSSLPSPWVQVDFDEVRETDVRVLAYGSGQRDGTAKSRYLVARARGRSIIASVPVDHSGRHVVGYLGAWWTPFSRNAVQIIETTRMPAGAGSLLPYQMDAAYEVRSQCAALVAIATFCLFAGIFLFRTTGR